MNNPRNCYCEPTVQLLVYDEDGELHPVELGESSPRSGHVYVRQVLHDGWCPVVTDPRDN